MEDVNPMRSKAARDDLRERVMEGIARGIGIGAIRHELVLGLLDMADDGELLLREQDRRHALLSERNSARRELAVLLGKNAADERWSLGRLVEIAEGRLHQAERDRDQALLDLNRLGGPDPDAELWRELEKLAGIEGEPGHVPRVVVVGLIRRTIESLEAQADRP